MTLRKKNSGNPLVYGLGVIGVLFMGIAAAGLLGAFSPVQKAPMVPEPEDVASDTVAETSATATPAAVPAISAQHDNISSEAYYPLEVGRYWIYASEDAERGTHSEVERRIVRRESRTDQELFYFSDGTVAFREDDKIYEMGPEGGVNVIPTGEDPFVYRSEGLHIEKQVGNTDTVMILGQQRYLHCVQVITRFRPVDQPQQEMRAYASYYARGIGLVGREIWPPTPGGAPAQILRDYGPRRM